MAYSCSNDFMSYESIRNLSRGKFLENCGKICMVPCLEFLGRICYLGNLKKIMTLIHFKAYFGIQK